MPLIIMRHAERRDYVDKLWLRKEIQGGRPWDAPLTDKGKVMAVNAGNAIRSFLDTHGLPPVTRALTSPLVRCVETCALAANAAGYHGKMAVEPALAEYVCDEWYYSWAIPGANANWGGPCHCRVENVRVPREKMHPAARKPVGSLYLTPEELNEPSISGSSGVDLDYVPVVSTSTMTRTVYDKESSSEASSRLEVLKISEDMFPGETVLLCSHGGPVGEMYAHLVNSTAPETRVNPSTVRVGYTALFLLLKEEGKWRALVAGSDKHRKQGSKAGSGGFRMSKAFAAIKKSFSFSKSGEGELKKSLSFSLSVVK
mmetsp:Transcript_7096/g.14338  ORF Transcript_7096/g.14338 Transcript_7096/m.14338 type:complete len:314 (-) Transcript_7096:154-1095(-)|eukprot:CAMPEP_0118933946 /NCGR_PEP_ID=MMETSP1169-20130426/13086_1 /TAXON_ID=36882 /ORGANISM="Pyramimonas obovata, Strain CCMP722" /LENGTH=313 /DNA_ID=CAMNT_0006876787 /DNA_START=145 /DNA_END=1086 /DNA_ORIENTATION=+